MNKATRQTIIISQIIISEIIAIGLGGLNEISKK